MLTVFTVVKSLVTIPVLSNSANQFSIAVVHTAFNVVGTAILYPFTGLLEKLATITVGVKEGDDFRTEYFNKKYKMYKEKYALGSAE